MKIKRRKLSKKIIFAILIAVVAVSAIVYFVYAKQGSETTKPDKPIKYSGPSEQDKKDAQDNKADVTKQQQIESNSSNNASSKKQVTPVITSANQNGQQVTVNAYISGIFEDGGTCTMTATKGSNTVTRTSKGFADATTTSCSPLFVNRSAFADSGMWSVTISYSSASAEGKSQTATLTIQ